jgi:hypothetical protein
MNECWQSEMINLILVLILKLGHGKYSFHNSSRIFKPNGCNRSMSPVGLYHIADQN